MIARQDSESCAVTISKKRLNGLMWWTKKEGLVYASVALESILTRNGIPELTDEQFEQKLKDLEVLVK